MNIKRCFRLLILFSMAATLCFTSGCAPVRGRPAPHGKRPRIVAPPPGKPHKSVKKPTPARSYKAPKPRETQETHAAPDPRMAASLNLTSQGEGHVREGRYDEAIHILERSLTIHSANGKSCYFLAEAWLQKGNIGQAKEFNRLAERYLGNDRAFFNRILKQKKQIDRHGVTTN